MFAIALAALTAFHPIVTHSTAADTIRLEVGSKLVDGRVYRPHAARVRVHSGSLDGPLLNEWTNELTVGDSAGRPVMRWVTKGLKTGWLLHQTYDLETLAPYSYWGRSANGAFTRLTFDGTRVRGTKRAAADSVDVAVDYTIGKRGFIASASDLVPLAVKSALKPGAVVTAPLWGPAMAEAEMRIFTMVGKERRTIEGSEWDAWRVEERRYSDKKLLATWYLVEGSPYMVGGEVYLPNGQVQHMTEIAIPMSQP